MVCTLGNVTHAQAKQARDLQAVPPCGNPRPRRCNAGLRKVQLVARLPCIPLLIHDAKVAILRHLHIDEVNRAVVQVMVGKCQGPFGGSRRRKIDVVLQMDLTQAIAQLRRVRNGQGIKLRRRCLPAIVMARSRRTRWA